ncbi:MAG: altronate dehydratase [Lachnospiraceae bacterium]|nr:altronate dehydratase [Lachnospiraceae bacterium]
MRDYIRINEHDSVAVALHDLHKGNMYCGVTLTEDIPRGHKFALKDMGAGETVYKYGSPIGQLSAAVCAGGWIHTHNLKTGLGEILEYSYSPAEIAPVKAMEQKRSFMGFEREDGSVGVRNEIWILPTVGCVSKVAQAIAAAVQHLVSGTIDAVVAFAHPYGCSQLGDDQENTRQIIADLASHPNAGGVLVLGLGCENSGIEEIQKKLGSWNEKRIRFLKCQDADDELAEGAKILSELAEYAGQFRRKQISCSRLTVGLKCGGSDGMSGITANPAVGGFSDRLTGCGGTTILTEVPEMFGAEQQLMNRCETPELFEKTVALVNDFKAYFLRHGQTVYENPSPGNKAGGITTLEDKSLGCTQKSGTSAVKGVLAYGERVSERGLHLLSAPGNDLVASTALAAAGAQIVLFTTGRGTPFSCPVPTVKISSNTDLADKKKNWIDFDAGRAAGDVPLSDLSDELFDYVIRVASGEKVCAERAGFHDMAIFKQGVTL